MTILGRLMRKIAEDLETGRIRARRSGEKKPGMGTGLTRDKLIDAVVATREADGTWPTQDTVAAYLNLADARRIRQVQGESGWGGILRDAEARIDAGK